MTLASPRGRRRPRGLVELGPHLHASAHEVDADASAEYGTLRHAARLVRVRADLDPADLDEATR